MKFLQIFVCAFLVGNILSRTLSKVISLYPLEQDDFETACPEGLLIKEKIVFKSFILLNSWGSDLFDNNTYIVYEVISESIPTHETHYFTRKVSKECENPNETIVCKEDKNIMNFSHKVDAEERFINARMRVSIKRDGKSISNDTQVFPIMYDPRNTSGSLTINDDNISLDDCTANISSGDLTMQFECSSPAKPCVIEINANDSTISTYHNDSAIFKRSLQHQVVLEILIKYAPCELKNNVKNITCIVTVGLNSHKLHEETNYVNIIIGCVCSGLAILFFVITIICIKKRRRNNTRNRRLRFCDCFESNDLQDGNPDESIPLPAVNNAIQNNLPEQIGSDEESDEIISNISQEPIGDSEESDEIISNISQEPIEDSGAGNNYIPNNSQEQNGRKEESDEIITNVPQEPIGDTEESEEMITNIPQDPVGDTEESDENITNISQEPIGDTEESEEMITNISQEPIGDTEESDEHITNISQEPIGDTEESDEIITNISQEPIGDTREGNSNIPNILQEQTGSKEESEEMITNISQEPIGDTGNNNISNDSQEQSGSKEESDAIITKSSQEPIGGTVNGNDLLKIATRQSKISDEDKNIKLNDEFIETFFSKDAFENKWKQGRNDFKDLMLNGDLKQAHYENAEVKRKGETLSLNIRRLLRQEISRFFYMNSAVTENSKNKKGSQETYIENSLQDIDCEKIHSHKDFIPYPHFGMNHLEERCNDKTVVELIKAIADLTVKLMVRETSEERQKLPEYKVETPSNRRYGTGMMHFFTYNKNNGKHCYCLDCSSSNTPKKSFLSIIIFTSTQVVFDELEANSTTFYLFYDESKSQEVALKCIRLISADHEGGSCVLECNTHDCKLTERLLEMNSRYCEFKNLVAGKIYSDKKLTVIVSHPYGRPKHISLGSLLQTNNQGNGVTRLEYDTCTCQGSAGAYVYVLGTGERWIENQHFHCKSETGETNLSTFSFNEEFVEDIYRKLPWIYIDKCFGPRTQETKFMTDLA